MALVGEGHHNNYYRISNYCINYSIIVFHINKLREFKSFDMDYIRAVMLIREGGGMHLFKGGPYNGCGT